VGDFHRNKGRTKGRKLYKKKNQVGRMGEKKSFSKRLGERKASPPDHSNSLRAGKPKRTIKTKAGHPLAYEHEKSVATKNFSPGRGKGVGVIPWPG